MVVYWFCACILRDHRLHGTAHSDFCSLVEASTGPLSKTAPSLGLGQPLSRLLLVCVSDQVFTRETRVLFPLFPVTLFLLAQRVFLADLIDLA